MYMLMDITGIVIVDKPAGWTSHDVVAKLRGALKARRVGHGGTLDPMATGVLPVFVGRATRAAEFCENSEKEYVAGLRFGLVTDTQDITGTVLSDCSECNGCNGCSECETSISADKLKSVIPRFLGSQEQVPPMYSAIKIGGKKLYELARRGIDVPRPARDIFISEIELLGGDGNDYSLRIVCSKGTYIRTLCHDIGSAVGCGAAMSSLRRTRAGAFAIGMAHTLSEVLDSISSGDIGDIVLPVDSIFSGYPAATLGDADTRRCKNGAPCRIEDLADGRYRFYGPDHEFLMLGEVVAGNIKATKGFYAP